MPADCSHYLKRRRPTVATLGPDRQSGSRGIANEAGFIAAILRTTTSEASFEIFSIDKRSSDPFHLKRVLHLRGLERLAMHVNAAYAQQAPQSSITGARNPHDPRFFSIFIQPSSRQRARKAAPTETGEMISALAPVHAGSTKYSPLPSRGVRIYAEAREPLIP